jgi:putative hydrolase of the HAD superfamily
MCQQMTHATVTTVLFDADGVLQAPVERWRPAFGNRFALADDTLDAIAQSVLATELDHLTRGDGFPDALAVVLHKWDLAEHTTDVLNIFNAILVDAGVLEVVQALRARGVRCHLATNQQSNRARHMSDVIGYKNLFDREFYSCQLGIAKPDIGFFKFILSDLQVPPSSVLFIDDREENVTNALAAGLNASVFPATGGAMALRTILARFGLMIA